MRTTAKKVLTALRLWDPWPCPLCQKPVGMDHAWRADFFEELAVVMRHLKRDCPVILAPPRF